MEGYLDLSRNNWWQSRDLSLRPREVHLGIPFKGVKEALTVFDKEWLANWDTLKIDFDRIQIPPQAGEFAITNLRRKFVFEFVVPDADKAFAWREERAKSGLYPADIRLTPEIVRKQNAIYMAVGHYLQTNGLLIYYRNGYDAPPVEELLPGAPSLVERIATPSRGLPRLMHQLGVKGFVGPQRLHNHFEILDRKVRVPYGSKGARIRIDDDELWVVPDHPIGEARTDYPRDWFILDPDAMKRGIFGRLRIKANKEMDFGRHDKNTTKLFGLRSNFPAHAFQLVNNRGTLVISSRGTRSLIQIARLEEHLSLDDLRFENLRALREIFGQPFGLLEAREALDLARQARQLFEDEKFRPRDVEGRPGGLLDIPKGPNPIIVGDLHGEVDNLVKILCENNFLRDLAHGKALLLLLGDVVHPEDGEELEDMVSSGVMLDLIFRLKVRFPESVFMLRGNHESFDASMSKGGVPQGLLFRRWLSLVRGETYAETILTFFEGLPLVARTDDYIASHAGPTRSQVDFATLVNVKKYPGLVNELTWNRLRSPRHPTGYTRSNVRRFRRSLHVAPDTPLIVGHNPQSPDEAYWVAPGNIRRHFIVYSARRDVVGVVVRINGRMVAMDYHAEPICDLGEGPEALKIKDEPEVVAD